MRVSSELRVTKQSEQRDLKTEGERNADMMNAGLDEPSCVWLACKQVQAVLFAATAAIYPLHPSFFYSLTCCWSNWITY